jgi:CheY-like chemotaxis protein
MLAALDWFLTSEGFEVITASRGSEALWQVRDRLPDLIITDYSMPAMTALELCQRLRTSQHTRAIPIILYTALSVPPEPFLYDRTFTKPADLDRIASQIRALLSGSRR